MEAWREAYKNGPNGWGSVGENIRPADNLDIYDTLVPLWDRKDELNPREKALAYAIAVLNRNHEELKERVKELAAAKPAGQAGGKKRSSKKTSKKTSKKSSKKAGSKKTVKRTSKK